MKVKLLSVTPDYMNVLETAIAKCHNTPLKDPVKTIKTIIDSGHLSVLEHCMASFEVTVSYSVLLQLSRHRHLSLTVQSSRACSDFGLYQTGYDYIDMSNQAQMDAYNLDTSSKEVDLDNAGYLLPRATEVNLVVSGNFRAWMEYLHKRLCSRVLKEHFKMAQKIAGILTQKCPEVFYRPLMNCDQCTEGSCKFK